ncbi:MAG: hypothetical protein WC022_02060 [Parcubacteria group bacterium]
MEFNQESNDEKMNEEETSQGRAKQWIQDNLRIIISVLIVVVIAGGIYSYSKRTQAPTVSEDTTITSETTADNSDKSADQATASDKSQATASSSTAKENTSSATANTSQETETSFIETAVAGDGMTKLARKSLANYLEKNPDSALSVEHKIYIEDYLRKNVKNDKGVSIGTSVEFSKDLIKTAIEKSKTLSPKQLQNLHKYAARVPSLS